MKIHKEGYLSIIIAGFFLILVGFAFNYFYPELSTIFYILLFVEIILFFLIVRFFRVPSRQVELDENAIISGADGTVVAIDEIDDNEYFNDKRIQVSVFMSPLNVHVNYYPISGKIRQAIHKRGRHLPAYLPKSSMENEQSSIVIEHKNKGKILLRQIAGSMARRIVFYSEINQTAKQGEELGIIKFGSRVDLLLHTYVKINVNIQQKVKAKLDVIAYFQD